MAWKNREGGDKSHANGVHFEKEARGKAIKAFVKDTLDARSARASSQGARSSPRTCRSRPPTVHDEALATLARLHDLPVQDSAERARIYREELRRLAGVPVAQGRDGPLVRLLVLARRRARARAAADDARRAAGRDARDRRARRRATSASSTGSSSSPTCSALPSSGFDAILGNPPWEIAKPNSKEFFSNLDPLYRGLGKQEARQTESLRGRRRRASLA